jgi:hypothetical protein
VLTFEPDARATLGQRGALSSLPHLRRLSTTANVRASSFVNARNSYAHLSTQSGK